MSTRLEVHEELRKRQLQERVLHERRCSVHEKEVKSESERISKEQESLRKQHERLEKEKRHYKENSFLTRDRRLSVPDDKLPIIVTDNKSKSVHSPDLANVKSRLFEYERSSPRSRRQLMQSTEGSPVVSPAPPRFYGPMSSHAFEANKASYTDVLKNISRLAHGGKVTHSVKADKLNRPDSVTSVPEKELEKKSSSRQHLHSELEKKPSSRQHLHSELEKKPSSRQHLHSELEKKLSSRQHVHSELEKKPSSRQHLHSELKVSFKDEYDSVDAPSPQAYTRRGSLQSSRCESIPSPYPQKRRASLPSADFKAPKPSQRRRHSLPPNQNLLPKIVVDGSSDMEADDNETRLTKLYNKAIETVQLADETLLTIERPLQQRLHVRRQSEGSSSERSPSLSSGFDLATLRELETILSDARSYSQRKCSRDDFNRLNVGTNRAQLKRIEHLEKVLKKLNPSYETGAEMDPVKVLQCSYLRLSKSNIETLENMIKEQGKDPGIHIHMDVKDCDIWKGLKEERTDLQKSETNPEKRMQSPKKAVHI